MNNKILAELDFNVILNESAASTQTGFELLNRYNYHEEGLKHVRTL